MTERFGYLRSDGNHQYVIPEELIAEHDKIAGEIESVEEDSDEWYNLIDVYERTFGVYRIGGNLNNMKILMENE